MSPFVPVTSASRLPLYMSCAAAAALPTTKSVGPKMSAGLALHEHMQMRSTHGVDAAMAAMPDIARRYDLSEKEASILAAKLRAFEWSPPSGSMAEVFLCLRKNGDVVRLATEGGRYPKLPPDARLTATVDILWCEKDGVQVPFDFETETKEPRCPKGAILWVCDYKGGKSVEDIESNRQLEACALLAGKWLKASHVVPAVIYPGKGKGEWDVPERPLTQKDAKEIEARIEKMERSIWSQRKRLEDNEPVTPVEGPHCLYCHAAAYCPAKVAMIKAITGAEKVSVPDELALTSEQASRMAEVLPQLEQFTKKAKSALQAYVKNTGQPIQLSDGRVWGPNPHREQVIVVDIAEKVIEEDLGGEAVKLAVQRRVSRSSIEEAVKDRLAAQGETRGVAPVVRRIFAKLGEAGALISEETEWWQAHKKQSENSSPAPSNDIEELT